MKKIFIVFTFVLLISGMTEVKAVRKYPPITLKVENLDKLIQSTNGTETESIGTEYLKSNKYTDKSGEKIIYEIGNNTQNATKITWRK